MRNYDVVLIGGGIMSATLASILKELQPTWTIAVIERLGKFAGESSNNWNNAGTGHSALCEPNYTPMINGSIETSKAVKIHEQFGTSLQYWSYLVENKKIPNDFIHPVPHVSLVFGLKDVDFLKKRYAALKKTGLYDEMQFTEDKETLAKWMPLVMKNRDSSDIIAATKVDHGTDVNFGTLTNHLFNSVDIDTFFDSEVSSLKQKERRWEITSKNKGEKFKLSAGFVFIGAGGGALSLLKKSKIHEGDGYGGFPVSGQFLVCKNKEIVEAHNVKAYGNAEEGSPPMSMPHLDTRVIDGKKVLIFGPYAGFSTKFLKRGSILDLVKSVQTDNIFPMLSAGAKNFDLTKFLVDQVNMTEEERMAELKKFIPDAKSEDWELYEAGIRVQVIKRGESGGVLEFGTEVISSEDGTIASLLGASPGASTSVSIMLELIEKCFPMKMSEWKLKLTQLVPLYGQSTNLTLSNVIRKWSQTTLEI